MPVCCPLCGIQRSASAIDKSVALLREQLFENAAHIRRLESQLWEVRDKVQELKQAVDTAQQTHEVAQLLGKMTATVQQTVLEDKVAQIEQIDVSEITTLFERKHGELAEAQTKLDELLAAFNAKIEKN